MLVVSLYIKKVKNSKDKITTESLTKLYCELTFFVVSLTVLCLKLLNMFF